MGTSWHTHTYTLSYESTALPSPCLSSMHACNPFLYFIVEKLHVLGRWALVLRYLFQHLAFIQAGHALFVSS